MRQRLLDARLEAAAQLFPRVEVGADIGADHGFLTRALLERSRADRMWAVDISAPSLKKAEHLIGQSGLSSRVLFGVGAGFMPIREPVEAAAILGMGGVNIQNMLLSQMELLHGCALVLSANSHMAAVRRTLVRLSYRIEDEVMTEAAGHFYPVLLARPDKRTPGCTERELLLGPVLIKKEPDDTYRRYVQKKLADWRDEPGPEGLKKQQWIREEWERVCGDSPENSGNH